MPEKKGNGGHGLEQYDPKTGKYVEDGQPNKYYDNPHEVINEEKKAENLFGLNFTNGEIPFEEFNKKEDVKNYFKNDKKDFLDDDNHVVDYMSHTVDPITAKVNFTDYKELEPYLKEVCQDVAWKNLLKYDKDFRENGSKTIQLAGEEITLDDPLDLYQYYRDFKNEIARKTAQYATSDEWYIGDDMLWDEKVNKVLNKLGLSSVDELVEKYNNLLWNDKKQRGFQMGKNAKQERKVVITTGLPASGKSITGEKNDILAGIEIDSDIAKELFPEYRNDKTMVSVVHSMSAVIRDVVLEEAIKRGYNLSLPTVGSKSNMDYFLKLFKDNGYDVQIANVYVPFEQNVARSITRMVQTGRLTDFPVLAKNLGSQKKVFDDIVEDFKQNGKSSGISGYAYIDNTKKHTPTEMKDFEYAGIFDEVK